MNFYSTSPVVELSELFVGPERLILRIIQHLPEDLANLSGTPFFVGLARNAPHIPQYFLNLAAAIPFVIVDEVHHGHHIRHYIRDYMRKPWWTTSTTTTHGTLAGGRDNNTIWNLIGHDSKNELFLSEKRKKT